MAVGGAADRRQRADALLHRAPSPAARRGDGDEPHRGDGLSAGGRRSAVRGKRAPKRASWLGNARDSRILRAVVARAAAAWIRFVWRTTRWRRVGTAHRVAVLATGGPVIAAFWHGRLFFSPLWGAEGRRTFAMISNNRDGALIAATAERCGIEPIRGSSADPRKPGKRKGGADAYQAAAEALAGSHVVAVTPDGPRGPRMRAQPGVAVLSARFRAPVAPIVFSTRRGRLARSWDRFLIPLPFDSGVMLYGPPIPPPEGDDAEAIEAHRLAIEAALNALTAEADAMVGRTPVDPDPPA
ncbi:MAG: DUF374 domain-containing protein [Rhodobacteraceae bacterium]|nr:MAG: DUF374 domain-containing protein [Paracoccaceae bacterium]